MNDYIINTVKDLVSRYGTRDPFELISALEIELYVSNLPTLKGYSVIANGVPYAAVNSSLGPCESKIVAAHELGHLMLHSDQLRVAPHRDMSLYDMAKSDKTEYEANLFSADLLVSDEDVVDLVGQEDIDYYSMASILYISPELLSFKLHSMTHRGYHYNIPGGIDSSFLGK